MTAADATPIAATRSADSIQRRVTRRLLVSTLSVVLLANVGLDYYLFNEVREQYDLTLKTSANAMTALVVASSVDHSLSFPFAGRDQRAFRRRSGHGDYFQVWDGNGKVVARSPSLGDADLPRATKVEYSIGEDIYEAPLPDGRPGHFVEVRFAPFVSDGEFATSHRAEQLPLDRPARLVFAVDRGELDETMWTCFTTVAIGALALAAAAIVAVVVIVRAGLQPLRRLAEDAARVDVDNLQAHCFNDDDLPNELSPIAQRMNDLLSRLGSAFARERRFTADAAHELRTPIAELRSLSEVALRWPPSTTAEHEANYRHMLGGARQMEAVVGALLTLARQQGAGSVRAPMETIPLAEVIAEAWRAHDASAAARGVTMRFDVPSHQTVLADRAILLALLHNLFSNVASYAPEDSEACCTWLDGRLSIGNDCGDLTPGDLPQLSRPFWRKDASRSSREAHAGLGLTLVMEYAGSLGIDCAFGLADGRFSVTLTWPQAITPTA